MKYHAVIHWRVYTFLITEPVKYPHHIVPVKDSSKSHCLNIKQSVTDSQAMAPDVMFLPDAAVPLTFSPFEGSCLIYQQKQNCQPALCEVLVHWLVGFSGVCWLVINNENALNTKSKFYYLIQIQFINHSDSGCFIVKPSKCTLDTKLKKEFKSGLFYIAFFRYSGF